MVRKLLLKRFKSNFCFILHDAAFRLWEHSQGKSYKFGRDDFVIYFAPIVNYIGEKQNDTALSQKNFMSCLSDRIKGEKPRFLNERAVHLRNL